MKRKLILKESVLDTINDINIILFAIVICSKGTLLLIPTLIVAIISVIIILLFGGVFNGR